MKMHDYKKNVIPTHGVIADISGVRRFAHGSTAVILGPVGKRALILARRHGNWDEYWVNSKSLTRHRPATLHWKLAQHIRFNGPGGDLDLAIRHSKRLVEMSKAVSAAA